MIKITLITASILIIPKYLREEYPAIKSPISNVETGNKLVQNIPKLIIAIYWINNVIILAASPCPSSVAMPETPKTWHFNSAMLPAKQSRITEKPVIPRRRFVFLSWIRNINGLENATPLVIDKIIPTGSK